MLSAFSPMLSADNEEQRVAPIILHCDKDDIHCPLVRTLQCRVVITSDWWVGLLSLFSISPVALLGSAVMMTDRGVGAVN